MSTAGLSRVWSQALKPRRRVLGRERHVVNEGGSSSAETWKSKSKVRGCRDCGRALTGWERDLCLDRRCSTAKTAQEPALAAGYSSKAIVGPLLRRADVRAALERKNRAMSHKVGTLRPER